ncbi:glycerol uptake facilitator protein [Orenia metallireducens]|jgi:glycerol uptake facilitator protein|uniref:Glycerol uptake facilitator protein n=1 Tax=Orenia metallireducens TaxID=1413210 RepID=A0A285HGZ9_9FIRM|nr:MIP family channel protein [Orenia metallireducens]PRX27159.1 glycerol uptake facilitator protein [Orenia metallireducens]SNY35020.1 glycerol uptake facilitator protein [Orenia metallireducens]
MEKSNLFGECLAEVIGTAILLFFGAGTVANLVLVQANIGWWELCLLWGLGVSMAVYITGGVSGAHINPAVTVALAAVGDFPWKKVVPYSISQIIGAFLGAAGAYFLYAEQFIEKTAENMTVFHTIAMDNISNPKAMMIELILTAILLLGIMAMGDAQNSVAPKGLGGALAVGLLVAGIGGIGGSLTGFAINPARDFGPKLFTAIAGWGSTPFRAHNFYFWVPIIGPLVGGVLGAIIYKKLIRPYLPEVFNQEIIYDDTSKSL